MSWARAGLVVAPLMVLVACSATHPPAKPADARAQACAAVQRMVSDIGKPGVDPVSDADAIFTPLTAWPATIATDLQRLYSDAGALLAAANQPDWWGGDVRSDPRLVALQHDCGADA